MMIIGIVALVVIGPERLPGAARTAGKYFAKLKRFVTNVRHDVEAELRADELRDIVSKQQEQLDSLRRAVSDVGKDVGDSVSSDWQEVVADINENGGEKHKQAHDDIMSQMNLQDDPAAENKDQPSEEPASEESSKAKADTGS